MLLEHPFAAQVSDVVVVDVVQVEMGNLVNEKKVTIFSGLEKLFTKSSCSMNVCTNFLQFDE